jgi:uncharacterized membrane protein YeiH
LIHFLDICGTFAFALSGAFRAVKYELDLLGVLVLAVVTGIGGGLMRDLLLGSIPPVGLVDYAYVVACLLGGILVFLAAPKIATQWDYVMAADAAGLSVFTAIGATSAQQCDATPLTIVLMAALTACGGGVIRDLLVGEIPAILTKDFYATAAILGGVCFVGLESLDMGQGLRIGCTIGVTLILRILAMKYHLHLPKVRALRASPSTLTRAKKIAAKKNQRS